MATQVTLNSGSVDSAGSLALKTNGTTTAVTIDTSQNVGIGTASPTNRLSFGANIGRYFALYEGTAGADLYGIGTETSAMTFKTAAAERMRIDSSGNLLVGTTSPIDGGKLSVSGSNCLGATITGNSGAAYQADYTFGSGTAFYGYWKYGGGVVGYITSTGSTVNYTSISDYRLKEDIQPMTGALAKVAALKPVTYKWKVDGSDGQGFIAHELAEVVPDCVVGQKDAVDAEGKPQYQGIDTSFLVATLTAAIQELKAIVDAQAVEIAALKGTA